MNRGRIGWTTAILLVSGLAARAGLVTNLTQHTSYTEIQGAVTNANDNDIIEVYDGTYTVAVDFKTKTGGNTLNGLTVRAAAGQHPVVSPSAAGSTAFKLFLDDDITVQGFEITGSNIRHAFSITAGSDRFRILDNVIHDLRTSSDCGAFPNLGSDGGCVNGIIAGNTIRNLGDGGDGSCLVVTTRPDWTGTPGLVFSNNTIRQISFSTSDGKGVELMGANMVVADNDISRFSLSASHAAMKVYGANALIQNNRIHHPSASTDQEGLWIGGGTNIVVNNNRITSSRLPIEFVNSTHTFTAYPTNAIFANNSIDTVMDARTWATGVSAGAAAGDGQQYRNNVFMANSYPVTISCKGCSLTGNSIIGRYVVGMATDGNTTPPANTWSGGFYSYDRWDTDDGQGPGMAAPFTIAGAAGSVDTSARPGYYKLLSLTAGSGLVTVGHTSDTNSLGQRTAAVYDTDEGVFDPSANKACLVHVAADTRDSTTGLPATQTLSAGATLQLLHTFANGEFFATLRLAYNAPAPGVVDYPTYDLFFWNARDYHNQHWELAVAGNVTNATFPVNDIKRLDGPPDTTLGHYGVDTANRIVWANINHASDFSAFASPPPTGTLILVR